MFLFIERWPTTCLSHPHKYIVIILTVIACFKATSLASCVLRVSYVCSRIGAITIGVSHNIQRNDLLLVLHMEQCVKINHTYSIYFTMLIFCAVNYASARANRRTPSKTVEQMALFLTLEAKHGFFNWQHV